MPGSLMDSHHRRILTCGHRRFLQNSRGSLLTAPLSPHSRSAGAVRQALSNAGFTVEKSPGFGRKREMLEGTTGTRRLSDCESGFPGSTRVIGRASIRTPEIAIIGAGIAGASLAHALRCEGFKSDDLRNRPASKRCFRKPRRSYHAAPRCRRYA